VAAKTAVEYASSFPKDHLTQSQSESGLLNIWMCDTHDIGVFSGELVQISHEQLDINTSVSLIKKNQYG